MKYSTACMVFAAFAAAAASVQANPVVSMTVTTLGETFFRLIKTQALVKSVEKRNEEFLSPALNDISRELHQGLDSKIFQIGIGIHNTLVDVNLKVGQISGNATSIISQIESVALTISTLKFSDARLDYEIKKNRIRKLCEDTLNMTIDVMKLIDETKEMLGKGVSGPLKMLQLTIQMTSDDKLTRDRANVAYQQSIIENPPRRWLFFIDYNAIEAAMALKRKGYVTIERIEKLTTAILKHIKWLEDACLTIRADLDSDRTTISEINGNISGTSGSVTMITEGFDSLLADSRVMSDNHLREGSKAMVQLMTNLKDQVFNITRNRTRRAIRFYDYTAKEPYQTAVSLQRPCWLKTPVNRCLYIFNNKTTGCIFIETFKYMKVQYIWLLNNLKRLDALFKADKKNWNDLTTEVLNVFNNTSHRSEVTKFVADLETKKLKWREDVDKIRDLSVSLNSYGESLFSEVNAQLNITKSNDDALNEDIKRFVNDNKNNAMIIIKEIENNVFDINNQ